MGSETVAHTVEIDLADGWPTARMVCPYEAADESRPCRPYDEDGEPSVPGDFCNWREWFDEGGLDCVEVGPVVTVAVEKATWDGDCFRFTLAPLIDSRSMPANGSPEGDDHG